MTSADPRSVRIIVLNSVRPGCLARARRYIHDTAPTRLSAIRQSPLIQFDWSTEGRCDRPVQYLSLISRKSSSHFRRRARNDEKCWFEGKHLSRPCSHSAQLIGQEGTLRFAGRTPGRRARRPEQRREQVSSHHARQGCPRLRHMDERPVPARSRLARTRRFRGSRHRMPEGPVGA